MITHYRYSEILYEVYKIINYGSTNSPTPRNL